MDQQEGTSTDMRIVQLHSAKAADAVKLIETIFKEEGPNAAGKNPQQMQMGPQGPQPPPAAA